MVIRKYIVLAAIALVEQKMWRTVLMLIYRMLPVTSLVLVLPQVLVWIVVYCPQMQLMILIILILTQIIYLQVYVIIMYRICTV